MAVHYLLNEEDRRLLREVIERERGRKTTNRISLPPEPLPGTPEVYIALTPFAGIPALNPEALLGTGATVLGTGTGSATGGNTPGSAICQVYQVVVTQNVPDLHIVPGLSHRVHNLSLTAIPGRHWVIATRDKYGTWFAVPTATAGGGGGSMPDFSGEAAVGITGALDISAEDTPLPWTAATYGGAPDAYWIAGSPHLLTLPTTAFYQLGFNLSLELLTGTGGDYLHLLIGRDGDAPDANNIYGSWGVSVDCPDSSTGLRYVSATTPILYELASTSFAVYPHFGTSTSSYTVAGTFWVHRLPEGGTGPTPPAPPPTSVLQVLGDTYTMRVRYHAALQTWQDTGGTVAADTDGDPVQLVWDQAPSSPYQDLVYYATGLSAPVIQTDAFSGMKVIRFAGSSILHHTGAQLMASNSTSYSIVLIYKGMTAGAGLGALIKDGNATTGVGIGVGITDYTASGGNIIGLLEALAWQATSLGHGAAGILVYTYDGSSHQASYWHNGVKAGSVTNSTTQWVAPAGGYGVGGYPSNAGGSHRSSFDLCELCCVDGVISAADIAAVSADAITVWGVAVNLVLDTFTGADNTALTAHTADVRPASNAWANGAGTFKIASNKIIPNSSADGDNAVIDSGASDVTVTCTLTPYYSSSSNTHRPCLVTRWTDTNNHWLAYWAADVNTVYLFRKESGTDNSVASWSPASSTSGVAGTLKMVTNGTSIAVYLNNILLGSTTSSFNQTATKHGIRLGQVGTPPSPCTWDDFSVTSP